MSASTSIGLPPVRRRRATTGKREVCLVFVSGKATRRRGRQEDRARSASGCRRSTASRGRSTCQPARTGARPRRPTSSSASARRRRRAASRRASIKPDDLTVEDRGKGTNLRHVVNILPETDPTAESLLVVEVITPGGHWSSYPPHKHDRDALPERDRCSRKPTITASSRRRASPSSGSTPTTARSTRRSPSADGDVTLVPRGYHPVRRRRTATTSTTSTSWPARAASGGSTTIPPTNGY